MQGQKMSTAKRAALAVVDRLDERDQVAVVVFDDRVDVVQAAAHATDDVKARIRHKLEGIRARARTALHEGWLTGCQAIARDSAPVGETGLARCFLLTDGLANVGVTDPEQIAGEAAGIREEAGIGTSTFGIGGDYDEALLGPMAVAGGGQFHHLRSAAEIAKTFTGELGDLLAAAAGQVRLELEADHGVTAEVISEYWVSQISTGPSRWSIMMGDLLAGEERHVVVRFGFPHNDGGREGHAIRARITWTFRDREFATGWQEVRFSYATHRACSDEPHNPDVMRWVGLHSAERVKREATGQSRRGDLEEARRNLQKVACSIADYAGSDQQLREAMRDLTDLDAQLAVKPLDADEAKEVYYVSQRRSRGQKDFRNT
jgi:Ca-activated chloride channel family protein